MTTYVAFAWGFGSASAAFAVLLLATRRRWRKPAPFVYAEFAEPLTDDQFDKLTAEWTARFGSGPAPAHRVVRVQP